jgi:hypothetical protein
LPAFHAREKEFDGGCFPLTVSDRAQVADNSRKSKVDASVSGTEAEVSDFSWFGSIHMVFWLHLVFRTLPLRPLAKSFINHKSHSGAFSSAGAST